ncbi:hypothetical protein D3C87_705020 [compost metagenome]
MTQHDTKPSYLDVIVTYEDCLQWGAPAIQGLSLEEFRAKYFADTEERALAHILSLPLHPLFALAAVLHSNQVEEQVLHGLALELGAFFLDAVRAEGVYIDFRSQLMLDTKRRWLNGQASTGEVASAYRLAAQAERDVSLLQDARVSAAAAVALAAGERVAGKASYGALRRMTEAHATPQDLASYNRVMREVLGKQAPVRVQKKGA